MKFHHWMAGHIPGYWNVFHLREKEGDWAQTSIKLRFVGGSEVILYGTSNSCKLVRKDGPMLSHRHKDGVEEVLIYHSPVSNEPSYPEHRHRRYNAFNAVPYKQTASAIVEVFAMVAAIPANSI